MRGKDKYYINVSVLLSSWSGIIFVIKLYILQTKRKFMQFKGFTLDRFQIEAINSIDVGNSVVVSAATGTGKTLIADYIIDKFLKADKKIMYTSPIKALSNQKYADFKRAYGEDKVGILTGDVSINPHAQVLILTTEIYRNMLLAKDRLVEDISYVIFDEIHYLADVERGAVWEESIIFSPPHVRFLCLSATIPNARQRLFRWGTQRNPGRISCARS